MPAEKSAYALARYSRSPDSVADSLEWVRQRGTGRFLDTFYFQYGHASIADLGHCIFCFEGVSELAAIEIEDEQLWDGQAKSSRYQDFSVGGSIVPEELAGTSAERTYVEAANALLTAYLDLQAALRGHVAAENPKPETMKPGPYRRTINARAYDQARYLLFLGVATNVGQVTSIRTLEKQMRRMGISESAEVRSLAVEMHEACAAPPSCSLFDAPAADAVAPTLAKYAEPDAPRAASRRRVEAWARANFDPGSYDMPPDIDLVRPSDPLDEAVATWIYSVTAHPYRVILDTVSGWSRPRRLEVLEAAREERKRRSDLPREMHSGYRYVFDIVCDVGGYRDLHRHRRCQQILQPLGDHLGRERPPMVDAAGLGARYDAALDVADRARVAVREVSEPASRYLLPFATRCRSLFKMDFAEAEYISRVRSGVKGHFSYRKVAWEMRERIAEVDPELAELIHADPPWVEDALTR